MQRDLFGNIVSENDILLDLIYNERYQKVVEWLTKHEITKNPQLNFAIDRKNHLIKDEENILKLQSGKYEYQSYVPKGKITSINKSFFDCPIGFDPKGRKVIIIPVGGVWPVDNTINRYFYYDLVLWIFSIIKIHVLFYIETPKKDIVVFSNNMINIYLTTVDDVISLAEDVSEAVEENELNGEMPYPDYELANIFDELEEEQFISPLNNLEKFTDDFKHMKFSELIEHSTGRGQYLEELIEENFLTLLEQVDKLPKSHKLDAFKILFEFVINNWELLIDHFPILLKISKKIMTYDLQCQFLSRLLFFDLFIESLVEKNLDQMETQIRTIIDNIDEIPESFRFRNLVHLISFVSIDASLMEKFSSSLLKCVDSLSEREERKINLRQLLTLRDLVEWEND